MSSHSRISAGLVHARRSRRNGGGDSTRGTAAKRLDYPACNVGLLQGKAALVRRTVPTKAGAYPLAQTLFYRSVTQDPSSPHPNLSLATFVLG